jgi:hypothetical protein
VKNSAKKNSGEVRVSIGHFCNETENVRNMAIDLYIQHTNPRFKRDMMFIVIGIGTMFERKRESQNKRRRSILHMPFFLLVLN